MTNTSATLDVKESKELLTPTDLDRKGTAQIGEELRHLLADIYALYFKTKNFHWHMSGPHFRDYHLLLDERPIRSSPSATTSPSAPARSVKPRCTPSQRSQSSSASQTTRHPS